VGVGSLTVNYISLVDDILFVFEMIIFVVSFPLFLQLASGYFWCLGIYHDPSDFVFACL